MSTDAQFSKGETVWYRGDEVDGKPGEPQLSAIIEVTNKNPAQYHGEVYKTGERFTCGESPTEPGAVFAL